MGNRKKMEFIWIFIFLHIPSSFGDCPCSVDDWKVLSCQPNTIANFPDDLNLKECDIDAGYVRGIKLSNQPFTILRNWSFVDFPRIEIVNLYRNSIEKIESGAFAGAPEIREVFLEDNKLEIIGDGLFDNLVKLRKLDIRDNPLMEKYVTFAW